MEGQLKIIVHKVFDNSAKTDKDTLKMTHEYHLKETSWLSMYKMIEHAAKYRILDPIGEITKVEIYFTGDKEGGFFK